MTLLLTAPARLALMLKDSHADIKTAEHYFQNALDEIERPGWLIFDAGSDHFQAGRSAERLDTFTETYRLELHGKRFMQGEQNQYEVQLRTLTYAAIDYFRRHQRLQFSDERGLEGVTYDALNGVQWITFQREAATLYGGEDQGPAWGVKINLTIHAGINDFVVTL